MSTRWSVLRIAVATLLAISVPPAPTAKAFWYFGGPALGAPTLVSPIDGVIVTSSPVFTWEGGVNAFEYRVKVWPAGHPSLLGSCSGWVPNLTLMCEDLPPGDYEWTVQSTGPSGGLGGISAIGVFTRATPFTASPPLTTPANGAVLDYPDDLGMLRWQPVTGVAKYQLQVSTSPTFADAGDEPSGNGELSSQVPREHIGVPQYWRVRGVNAAQTWGGPWSATRSFTVHWEDVPVPMAPADGASASNVILVWDPVKGATNYEVAVTSIEDADFSDAIVTTPSYPAHWAAWGDDFPAGDLRWRVRGMNDHGGRTAWSMASTVHRDPDAPAALEPDPVALEPLELLSPADGVTLANTWDHPLRWEPIAGATGYQIDLRQAGGAWWGLPSLGLRTGAPMIGWRFEPGATYGWRARAIGDLGELGPWSEEREITIAAPPQVILLTPDDGADLPASSTFFTWQPLAGSGNYSVELADNPDFDPPLGPYGSGKDATSETLRGTLSVGRWYWRVRAGYGGTEGLSEVRAFDVIDDLAPVGGPQFQFSWTEDDSALLGLNAEDPLGEVVEVQTSPDGVTWESHAYPPNGLSLAWPLTDPANGGPDPGQRHVHARFRDAAGNWSTISSASIWYGMQPPLDETPPTGAISVAEGAAWTRTRHPIVDITATDVAGVAAIALSTDGVTWEERPYWPTQQVTLSPSNGKKTVRVKWKDWNGNWSAVAQDTIVLDTVAPTSTAPKAFFRPHTTVTAGLFPMRFEWSGSDATSGVARYEAALSTDSGGYATLGSSLTSATLYKTLATGHTYRLRVRPVDKAGNVGPWSYGGTFSLKAFQESSTSIVRGGTWTQQSSSNYWAGAQQSAKTAGAYAKLRFTGRSFAWVGSVGPNGGSARVYVNGVLVKTISLYSTTAAHRRVLVTFNWSTAVSRSVKIVVVGTVGHPRVYLDAFVVRS